MKITIDIPEDEVLAQAKAIVAGEIAQKMLGDYFNSEKYCYRQVIKDVVREVIREDKKNLEDRAVAAAAKSIKKEAVKKLMAELEDE